MLTVKTNYFGAVEYDEGSVWEFPEGIPGFENEREFVPVRQPSSDPLLFLQSVDRPEVCLVVVPVGALRPDFRLSVSPDDLELLGLPAERQPETGSAVLVLTVVSIQETGLVTANLLAPIVVNLKNGRAVQAIQVETSYSHREPLDAPAAEPVCS